MTMCSDFSLKALIHVWGEELPSLGPAPFERVDVSLSMRF
eukprot:SAG31_NODE_40544_length_280_cov_0.718232_1_plen_39_part_01